MMLERNVILMERELGIYVHIPFCIKKCAYCDFISYPNKLEMQKMYVDKLLEEMDNSKKIIGKCNITSIYIGGGTPSAIDSELIKKIIFKIKELERNSFVQEVTIEVNPGTVTQQKLNDYIEAGINRLSIGLQSTNDNLLRLIGRIHTYQEFLKTYEMAVNTGFKNINVDLMIGLPNQTIGDIKESIDKITSLNPMPQHISVYSLIVEPNTLMEKWVNEEKFDLPLDEEPMNLYQVIYSLQENKLIPVIAHPERYEFIQKEPEFVYELIEKGCYMQANYGSILGQYGRKSQLIVKKLLENHSIHFLGSDVHRQGTIYPKMSEALLEIENIIGKDKLKELTTINPKLALGNKRIDIDTPYESKLSFKEKIKMYIKSY